MSVQEQYGVLFEQPQGEILAQAIYVPGFGDTPEGAFGRLLRRRLLEGGIAVASVLSSELDESSGLLHTISLSAQTECVFEVMEGADQSLPIHGIGMSQGGFVISRTFLPLATGRDRQVGTWFTVNTPATGPVGRLETRMVPGSDPNIQGIIEDLPQHVAVTHDYWQDADGLDPLTHLQEAYQHAGFNVVLADQDEVLREEASRMAEEFGIIDPRRLHIISGANHYLTNNGGQHRRKVVGLIMAKLMGQE